MLTYCVHCFREQEEEKLKTQAMLKDKATEQPWSRILDLVDINPTRNRTDSTSSKKDCTAGSDISRMKSILVQLKNAGGLEINQA